MINIKLTNFFLVRAHDDAAEQGDAQMSRDHDDDDFVPLGLPQKMQARHVRTDAVQTGSRC